jgi:hypothetical protein
MSLRFSTEADVNEKFIRNPQGKPAGQLTPNMKGIFSK